MSLGLRDRGRRARQRCEAADAGDGAVPLRSGLVTALLLIEGFSSLGVEMIALRMLVPVAGQSIGVTSVVVTAFLGALALGYRTGGSYAGPPGPKVARNLAVASVWAAFWLSHMGIRTAFVATGFLGPLGQVAVYAVAGVGPPAWLLAETVVLLVQSRRGVAASAKAGGAFAASTVGNVAGGLVIALVVMRYLGVAAALGVVVALLLAGVCLVWRSAGWAVRGMAALAMAGAGANATVESGWFTRTTAHADYVIEDLGGGARGLRVNGQRASREDGRGVGYAYVELIEDAVFAGLPDGRAARALVIGAGGFTFARGRAAEAVEVTYVDVDEVLAEVADEFLGEGRRGGRYVARDGRAFLLEDRSTWDVIVLDAYADRTSMPPHLYTVEFFRLVRARLAEGAQLYVNVISRPWPGGFETRLHRTLGAVFAWCETLRVGDGGGWHNRIHACRRHALDGDRTVYSDARTVGEFDAGSLGL